MTSFKTYVKNLINSILKIVNFFLPKNKLFKFAVISLIALICINHIGRRYAINHSCVAIRIFKAWDDAMKCHDMIKKYHRPEDMYTFYKISRDYVKIFGEEKTSFTKDYDYDYLYFANKYLNNKYIDELKEFESSMTKEEKIKVCNKMITNYSHLTENALAIEVDHKKAFEYAIKSANLGSARDQEYLAIDYLTGEFQNIYKFPKDYIQAYKWFYISYHSGNDRALNGIKKMETLMTKEEIDNAKLEAKKWLSDYKNGKIEVKLYD